MCGCSVKQTSSCAFSRWDLIELSCHTTNAWFRIKKSGQAQFLFSVSDQHKIADFLLQVRRQTEIGSKTGCPKRNGERVRKRGVREKRTNEGGEKNQIPWFPRQEDPRPFPWCVLMVSGLLAPSSTPSQKKSIPG